MAFNGVKMEKKVLKNNFRTIDIVIRIIVSKNRTYKKRREIKKILTPRFTGSSLKNFHAT